MSNLLPTIWLAPRQPTLRFDEDELSGWADRLDQLLRPASGSDPREAEARAVAELCLACSIALEMT
jgi:hypothetical protein